MKIGETYRVCALPEEWRTRFNNLGITVGASVKITAVAPLGDPVIIEVRGTRYAVRKSALNRLLGK